MKLYGRNPVLERLKFSPRTIKKIYVQEGHPDQGYICKKTQPWGIPVYVVPGTKIQKIARNLNSQGILAEISDFPYLGYDELLETAKKKNETVVFLDSLTDPQNLGGIIRSLACLGGFSVVLPTHSSVEVTETALRVACGGENYLSIAKVANLGQAIAQAKEEGFWIAGAVVKGGQDIREVELPFPLGVVIGSEDKGIREVIQKQLDVVVTIPMSQPRLSLNVAHATTLLCYEVFRQRKASVRREQLRKE